MSRAHYTVRPGGVRRGGCSGAWTAKRRTIRRYFALVTILLLAAALRCYHLASVPTELIVDEIDLYNSVSSIVATGHDVDGTLQPFLYSQFTRNPPVYGIASYASSRVLGKNAFGLRFPAVLFGLAAIVFVFLLVQEITRRDAVALLAALFVAVAPIFVQFSRIGWEPAAELPFLLAGLYLLMRGIRLSGSNYAFSAIALAIACYTYMTGWFYAVILAGSALAIHWKSFRSWKSAQPLLGALVLWAALAAPALWMCFFDPLTASKVSRVSTFSHGVTLDALKVFMHNYAAHFSLSYLVVNGAAEAGSTWRYLNGFGAFYWWIIPLAAAGLVATWSGAFDKRVRAWLIVWLLAYPLAGAVTNDGVPNAPRTLAGAPVFCIFAAIGAFDLYAWISTSVAKSRRVLQIVGAAVLLLSVFRFSANYFVYYVHRNSNAWDSGTRSMFAAIERYRSRYERVCISVWPAWYGIESYLRFYMPGDDGVITSISAPACYLPGTLLVTDNDQHVSRHGFTPLTTIRDVNGAGFAHISGRSVEFAQHR